MGETKSAEGRKQEKGELPPPRRPVDLTGIYRVSERVDPLTGEEYYYHVGPSGYWFKALPIPPHLVRKYRAEYRLVDRFGHVSALYLDNNPPQFEVGGVRYSLVMSSSDTAHVQTVRRGRK